MKILAPQFIELTKNILFKAMLPREDEELMRRYETVSSVLADSFFKEYKDEVNSIELGRITKLFNLIGKEIDIEPIFQHGAIHCVLDLDNGTHAIQNLLFSISNNTDKSFDLGVEIATSSHFIGRFDCHINKLKGSVSGLTFQDVRMFVDKNFYLRNPEMLQIERLENLAKVVCLTFGYINYYLAKPEEKQVGEMVDDFSTIKRVNHPKHIVTNYSDVSYKTVINSVGVRTNEERVSSALRSDVYTRLTPVWEVKGHYRHYKSGKVVYIAPHQRGPERGKKGVKPTSKHKIDIAG